jgi:hypothetical protein
MQRREMCLEYRAEQNPWTVCRGMTAMIVDPEKRFN